MKRYIWVVLLLLLIPFVHSVTIFNGYKYNYDTFAIGSNIYTITAYENFSSIRLQVNGQDNYLIKKGRCIQDGLNEYCYNDTNYDLADIDKYNRESPAIKLIFNTLEPKLSITRTITPTPAEFDQTMTVSVVVKNTGTKDALDIAYVERVPDNVEIISTSENAQWIGKKIFWNFGKLSLGKQQTFSYKVRAIKYVTDKNTAFASYTYEGVMQNITSQAMDFAIKTPFKLSTTLDNANPDIGDVVEYTINIENTEIDKDLTVYLVTTIPLELNVLSKLQFVEQEGNQFVYQETLPPTAKKKLPLTVKGDLTGSYNLSTVVRFLSNGKYIWVKNVQTMKIATTKISPAIFLSVEDIRAGEPFEAMLDLSNRDPNNIYSNIRATFYSPLFSESISLDSLAPGKEYVFKNRYFTKMDENITQVPIEVRGTFESAAGEKFSFYTKKLLKVGPANKTLDLIQTVSNKTVSRGQQFTVETSIQNLKDVALSDIQVDDYFPEELQITQGKTTAFVPILPGDKKMVAYAYQLSVPLDYPRANITVVSRLTTIIQGQEYTRSVQNVIQVPNTTMYNSSIINATVPSVNGSANKTNSTIKNATGNGSKKPVSTSQDAGFFGKIWDGIKGFFAGIFGSKK